MHRIRIEHARRRRAAKRSAGVEVFNLDGLEITSPPFPTHGKGGWGGWGVAARSGNAVDDGAELRAKSKHPGGHMPTSTYESGHSDFNLH